MKSLHWDITNRCNLRCKHCYNADRYFNANSKDYSNKELSLDDSLKIVDKIMQDGFDHIHLVGGEPLGSANVMPIIKRAKEYGLKVTINSNATLLDSKMQDKLIELEIDHFAASIDGVSTKTNDWIRGNGTFEVVCSNMKEFNKKILLSGSLIQTCIVSTITRANYNEIIKLPRLAREIGCHHITIATFIESGNGRESKEAFEAPVDLLFDAIFEMIKKELDNTNDLYFQLDSRPYVVEYLHSKFNAPILFNPKNALCCAGEDIWYMEADGDIHPCLVYRLNAGIEAQQHGIFKTEKLNLSTNEISCIRESKYWRDFLKYKNDFDVSKIIPCDQCKYTNICMPCPFEYFEGKKNNEECMWVIKKLNEDICNLKKIKVEVKGEILIKNNEIVKAGKRVLEWDDFSLRILQSIVNGRDFATIVNCIVKACAVTEERVQLDVAHLMNYFISRDILSYK